jgi:signal transduction histidine kinase/Flp pilus assembly protein TadD
VVVVGDSAKDFNNPSKLVDYYLHQAEVLFWLDVLQSEQYAQKALNLALRLQLPTKEAQAYLWLGQIEAFRDPAIAARYYAKAEKKALEQTKDFGLHAEVYRQLANFYLKLEQYDLAIQYLQKCNLLAKQHRPDITVYGIMGHIYAKQKNLPAAIEAYQKQLAFQKRNKNWSALPSTLSEMGNAYYQVGNFDQARNCYLQGIQIAQKYGDHRSLGFLKDNVGLSFFKQGEFSQALVWQQEAVEHRRSVNSESELAVGLNNIASTLLSLGQPQAAIQTLVESYPYTLHPKHIRLRQEASQLLAKAYEQQKRYDSAFFYMQVAHTCGDTLRQQERERALKGTAAIIEVQQQKYENTILLQKNRQWFWVSLLQGVAVLLVLGIVLLLIRQGRISKGNLDKERIVNQTKNRLFAIVSHDLRSPINSLLGLFSLFDNNNLSNEEFLHLTRRLKTNVETMSFTLNNLLYWAKSQLEGIETIPKKHNLATLCNENIVLHESQAVQKQINIKHQVPSDLFFWGDLEQINLVLRNLLVNAIKFSPIGGEIQLHACTDGQFLLVSVKDKGVGLSLQQQEALFTQALASTPGTAREKGTGLGLMLCKEFVENNGGRIWAESQMGQGSIFYFTTPRFWP